MLSQLTFFLGLIMCGNIKFKLSILFAIIAFGTIVLTIPTVEARGGGHHAGSGSHGGGHSGHVGVHRGNHGGHSRHFGGGHRHSGGSHRHFGGHRNHSSGHRSHNSGFGSHRHSSRHNHNYYPRSYGYSYTPRYPYRSYSSYRPRYYSPRSYTRYAPPTRYISTNPYPSGYPGSTSYNSNSADVRYIEKDMETKLTNNEGWRLLAQNRSSEALSFFSGQAGRYQKDGVPKVGYALSTAMQGDLDRAAWAMRRAFRIDPNALHYVNIEQPLRIIINKLITAYNAQLDYSYGAENSDAAFMVAALNYLLHNENAARKAIEEAMGKANDNSQSAQNLYNLVINTP